VATRVGSLAEEFLSMDLRLLVYLHETVVKRIHRSFVVSVGGWSEFEATVGRVEAFVIPGGASE
jgi:hypothetical protein